MTEQKRTPNKNGEFLLDVLPMRSKGESWTIYDISSYLPHWEGYDRQRYMNRVAHTIKGNQFTVFIIDFYESLTDKQAILLAGEWYRGNTVNYRLD